MRQAQVALCLLGGTAAKAEAVLAEGDAVEPRSLELNPRNQGMAPCPGRKTPELPEAKWAGHVPRNE